jgi:murein L,D-transpeptidase YafK
MRQPSRSRLGRTLLFGLAAILTAIAAWVLADWMVHGDWEHVRLERERTARAARASTGQALPGTPDLDRLDERLASAGVKLGAPVFIRIFKQEFELELWLKHGGKFQRFATYPVCRWSGRLGPKVKEGDHQAPEGFYTVDATQLNPQSRWHRSFNLGFPNALDRAHGRTGSFLMVHGGCGSVGCYAMTDPVIDEIWRIITAALANGQPRFHVHVFPFRPTGTNITAMSAPAWTEFWHDLKAGYDLFEATQTPPRINICQGRYVATTGETNGNGSHPLTTTCPAVAARPRRQRHHGQRAAKSPRRPYRLNMNPIQHLGSGNSLAKVRTFGPPLRSRGVTGH